MPSAAAEAPGKILLMGEHAVVYGHPAVAIPLRGIRARVEVSFTRNGGIEMDAPDIGERVASGEAASPRLAPLVSLAQDVLRFFGEERQGVSARIASTIPVSRGMGSGSAVSVALVRAICRLLHRKLDANQVAGMAMAADKAFHGNPSGVDSAVVARDRPLYFVRGKPMQEIEVGAGPYHFLVADTGISAPTSKAVEAVRLAREQDRARFDSYLWELGSMASMAREIIRAGAPEELALCMNQSHDVLRSLGVSCDALDRLVSAAIEHGALGAKLSGAGMGGAVIALLKSPEDASALETQLRLAGARNVFPTALGQAS